MSTFDVDQLLQQAANHYDGGDVHAAKQLLTKIFALDKRNPYATYLRALVSMAEGASDIADKLFQEAIRAAPQAAMIHSNYAKFCLMQSRFERSLKHASLALTLLPDATALLLVVECHLKLAQIDSAGKVTREKLSLLSNENTWNQLLALFLSNKPNTR